MRAIIQLMATPGKAKTDQRNSMYHIAEVGNSATTLLFDESCQLLGSSAGRGGRILGVANLVHNAMLVMCLFRWGYTFVVPRWRLGSRSFQDHLLVSVTSPTVLLIRVLFELLANSNLG